MTEETDEGGGREALEILADSADLYERKNEDYGDSWKLVGKILAMILEHQGVETLEIPVTPENLNSLGLFFRRGDKFCREFNGWFVLDHMNVDESIAETHQDDVPYGAMHTELAESVASEEDPLSGYDQSREEPQDGMVVGGYCIGDTVPIGGIEYHVTSVSLGFRMDESEVLLRNDEKSLTISGPPHEIEQMRDDQ